MNDIRFLYFDAGGTLLLPQPGVGEVYADVGRRFGSRREAAELTARFRVAFRRQEALDAAAGWHTSRTREQERWRAIVAETLDDVNDPEGCFTALYDYFARPEAWACPPEAAAVLDELQRRGYGLGVASNFDERLYLICAGKPELRAVRQVQTSVAIGWSKPAPAFFEAVAQAAGVAPQQILFIGDDVRNDYDGPRAAGFAALLLDPRGRGAAGAERVASLAALLDWLSR